jgi:predicted DNA binding CopG/RHH family protein/uncharacterized DUF497 family protein
MQILWDDEKGAKLIAERGISFSEFAKLILDKEYQAILKNPARAEQKIFVIPYRNYTYVVPFIIDDEQNIVLKTIFPSRKYHKLYGGKKMNATLDGFEQEIEDAAGLFVPVSENEQAEIEMIIAAANKTKNINIRISEYDLEKVKQKSAGEGLPYQTLISSVIHKYIAGKLIDEQAVLKSMQLLRR